MKKTGCIPRQAKVLQKMRELEPDNLNLRVKIVEINLQAGNEEQARQELQEILDGLAGDDGRALKIHELFLSKFPQDPVLKIGLGEALIHKGEITRGISLLNEVLSQDPENDRILRALAEGYRCQGASRTSG